MQMSESVALLRALKEINKGTGRIAKLLSEALARDAKTESKPPKRATVVRGRA
jgi:hypothetical protein